jgi:hypothetical protein
MRSHLLCAAALLFWAAGALADEKVEPGRIRALVRQLDDDEFAVRQGAERALRRAGKAALPLLRRELAGKPSLETAHRLRRVIAHLRQDDEAQVRALIEQLGADSYEERQRATAELIRRVQVEPDFLALVRGALRHPDLEVRKRSQRVLATAEGKR